MIVNVLYRIFKKQNKKNKQAEKDIIESIFNKREKRKF